VQFVLADSLVREEASKALLKIGSLFSANFFLGSLQVLPELVVSQSVSFGTRVSKEFRYLI
jgi:hypothetical protein